MNMRDDTIITILFQANPNETKIEKNEIAKNKNKVDSN